MSVTPSVYPDAFDSDLPNNFVDWTGQAAAAPADAILHAAQMNKAFAAIRSVQLELGLTPSGAAESVAARLTDIQGELDALAGTVASKADAAATTSALAGKLGAGAGAVGTSNLADGAVTAAKVAADVATQAELDAVSAALAGKAASSHAHAATDFTSGVLPIVHGGTGGGDAAAARSALGLGSAATMTPAALAADSALTGTFGRKAGETWTGTHDFAGATVTGIAGGGGAGLPSSFVTRTTTATATAGQFVLADATSGGFTVTLPASPPTGTLVSVEKIDATSNVVTVLPGSGTIRGDANALIVALGAGATFEWDGSDWRVAATFAASLGGAAGMVGGGRAGDLYGYRSVMGSASGTYPVSREQAIPFVIPPGRSVAGVSLRVETLTAGAVARIGWRHDDGGWPGALAQDLGTVSLAATGTVALSAPVSPGGLGLFWVTVTPQGGAAVLRQDGVAVIGGKLEGVPMPSDAFTTARVTPIQDGVTGALPASFAGRGSNGGASSQFAPLVLLTLA